MVSNQQTSTADEGKSRVPMGVVAAGVVAVPAAIGLTILKLASGPDAAQPTPAPIPVVQIDPSVIGPDAPVLQLGQDAEEGSWRRGINTRMVFGDTPTLPEVTIQAADFEPGRYEYGGDLVIQGEFTQPYVEITAANISFEGGITASNIRLIALEGDAEWSDPEFMHLANGKYSVLTGFESHTPRGNIAVGGSVQGDDINMLAGRVDIQGDAIGTITLSASQGENRDLVILSDLWEPTYTMREEDYLIPREERPKTPIERFYDQEIPLEHTREAVHWAAQPAATSISIGGSTGPGVTIQTPRDAQRAAEHAAWAERIQRRASADKPGIDDLPVDTVRRRPIP